MEDCDDDVDDYDDLTMMMTMMMMMMMKMKMMMMMMINLFNISYYLPRKFSINFKRPEMTSLPVGNPPEIKLSL